MEKLLTFIGLTCIGCCIGCCISFCISFSASAQAAEQGSAQVSGQVPNDGAAAELLAAADAVRNPADSFRMLIQVQTANSDQEFEVLLKGGEKTLVVVKKPTRDVGRNMLMLERDFYAYIPNLKRSMRLSLAQKMAGEVANGDIARTRWAGDYAPVFEKKSAEEAVLFLEGNKPGLTYAKIRLWIEVKTRRPLRAEFLGLDGKTVLKRAWYEDYKPLAGAQRPSSLRIEDTAGKKSTIRVLTMETKELSDSLFSVPYLEKAR